MRFVTLATFRERFVEVAEIILNLVYIIVQFYQKCNSFLEISEQICKILYERQGKAVSLQKLKGPAMTDPSRL